MQENKIKANRKHGRPMKYPMPERIDASPETTAELVLRAEPKNDWLYERKSGRKRTGN